MDDNQPIVKERKARHTAGVDELVARANMWRAITDMVNIVSHGAATMIAEALQQQQTKGKGR